MKEIDRKKLKKFLAIEQPREDMTTNRKVFSMEFRIRVEASVSMAEILSPPAGITEANVYSRMQDEISGRLLDLADPVDLKTGEQVK